MLSPASSLAAGAASVGHGQILWDTYGIPHIFGADRLAVVRGLGYAEMEGQAETMLANVAQARGRMAEYFGAGTDGANVASDIQVRTERIPERAALWVLLGGREQRRILQAFADGVNEYAAQHGDTIAPSFRRVLPFLPSDVTSGEQNTVNFTFMPEQDNLPALLAAWKTGGRAAANALARSLTPGGSNGWAIAPSKSTSGNAILMGNPHLPWGNNQPIPGLGLYQWMEVNLVIGDPGHPALDASGVVFTGLPFLGIGYSDDIGWTHTNNTIQNANYYEFTVDQKGFYQFGGASLPLITSTATIKIRNENGSFSTKTFRVQDTIDGPVVAQSGDKVLALRVAGLDQPSLVTQYWHMIEAHNLSQFIAANSMLQMPFFNVVYADRDGHVMYVFGGRQPVRAGGTFGDYDGILDGSNPSTRWTRTFDWGSLPRAIDPPGGFVANSNNPPWTSTFPLTPTNDPSRFPAYVAPSFMDLRPQNAANFLLSQPKFTADALLAGKENVHMELADRVLPDLIQAAKTSGNATAIQAAGVLEAWDRNADALSRGAVLFERWWNIVSGDPAIAKDDTINFYSPHPKFRVGWSAAAPLTTPSGLADAKATIADLVSAAEQTEATYGSLDAAWEDAHRTVLVTHDATFAQTIPVSDDAVSGSDGKFGPVRVVNSFQGPVANQLWSYAGDGYVQLVEFTPQGAKARALLGYGNSSRPGSPHVTDQLAPFNAKALRPVWRTRAEVEQHLEKTEAY
ncbi:penicillin acylase family protein [Lichenicoccus sp.]|uniref:penicillin acylase family protein n=1 Tax=Lichenicoccus sp. TaxID=2781899 RepID=UPI003D0EFDE7